MRRSLWRSLVLDETECRSTAPRNTRTTVGTWVWVAFCLAIPATSQIERHFGLIATVGYLVVIGPVVLLIGRYVLPPVVNRISGRCLVLIELAVLGVLIAGFLVLFPIADARKEIGLGGDKDDALNIAVTELVHGRYPYYPCTYLGAKLSPLPGAVLLAAPFVALGSSAYQNILWIMAFYVTTCWYTGSRPAALLLLCIIFALCPSALRDYVAGSDVLANGIYVLVFALLMLHTVLRENARPWQGVLAAVLLGVAVSSRLNFTLVVPLIASVILQRRGPRQAIVYTAVVVATFAALTLPFYFYDPQGFSPLHTLDMVAHLDGVLPFGAYLVPAGMVILALLLSLRRMNGPDAVFLYNCAIVQAFPVLCGIVLEIVYNTRPDSLRLIYASYGLNFLFFGLLAAWGTVVGSLPRSRTTTPQRVAARNSQRS
jgi:hypothetical protein